MKKTSLRRLTLILALALTAAFILSGCDSLSGAMKSKGFSGTKTVTVSSSGLYLNVQTTMTCDFSGYFDSKFDFTEVNDTLKKFCFVSLIDAHNNGVASLENAPNTDETNNEKFLKAMGFTNIEQYTVGSDATEDTNDTIPMVISKKFVGYGSSRKAQYFINVSLCATGGSNEWLSNFDFGADIAEYEGTHSDWLDKNAHKGFDVAANRAVKVIANYISSNKTLSSCELVIAISGYSRGAAVANLVAAKLDDNPELIRSAEYDTVAYTFATPRTTTYANVHADTYDNIHNYINTDDLVTEVPTKSMGFDRYGQDHTFSIQNDSSLKSTFNKYANEAIAKDSETMLAEYDASCASNIQSIVNDMLNSREAVYRITEDEAHMTYKIDNVTNTTAAAAQAAGDSFLDTMNRKGSGQYFKDAGVTEETYEEEDEDGDTETKTKYIWHCYVGDGVILKVINTCMSAAAKENYYYMLSDVYLLKYSRFDTYIEDLLYEILMNPTYVTNAHYPLSYFIGAI